MVSVRWAGPVAMGSLIGGAIAGAVPLERLAGVLALLGEGAAMYGIQGMWSAAKYRVPVTFVIANNAQYQILKIGAAGLDLPSAKAGKYLGLDLTGPEIDFVGLAKSLGVEARRINEPEELADAVSKSLAGDQPMLFDVPIERRVQGRLNYG